MEGNVEERGATASRPENTGEERDWVKEAYECFIKNAVDMEPTDPAAAVWEYFKKNATDELKAKVEAEGKTGESCWKFIEAVAHKALGGKSGHIDPVAIYAIAMHYYQDVPVEWEKARGATASQPEKAKEARGATASHPKNKEATPSQPKSKKATASKPKKAKKGKQQGFFFDLMEMDIARGATASQPEEARGATASHHSSDFASRSGLRPVDTPEKAMEEGGGDAE